MTEGATTSGRCRTCNAVVAWDVTFCSPSCELKVRKRDLTALRSEVTRLTARIAKLDEVCKHETAACVEMEAERDEVIAKLNRSDKRLGRELQAKNKHYHELLAERTRETERADAAEAERDAAQEAYDEAVRVMMALKGKGQVLALAARIKALEDALRRVNLLCLYTGTDDESPEAKESALQQIGHVVRALLTPTEQKGCTCPKPGVVVQYDCPQHGDAPTERQSHDHQCSQCLSSVAGCECETPGEWTCPNGHVNPAAEEEIVEIDDDGNVYPCPPPEPPAPEPYWDCQCGQHNDQPASACKACERPKPEDQSWARSW